MTKYKHVFFLQNILVFILALLFLQGCATKISQYEHLARKAINKGYVEKRVEMRGVWMPTISRNYYRGKSVEEIKNYLRESLDRFQEIGVNVVFFQVRSEGDAFYPSTYEPWSRYLTGVQGRAPSPFWDPLAFMIEEAHKRHMELHAWINPYRVAVDTSSSCASKHVSNTHPEWCVHYGNLLILNPALPEVRNYTANIVSDLVQRYDLDGIHMDDYFYPYPQSGIPFKDEAEYLHYGRTHTSLANFRRENVNSLIELLHKTIKGLKPWVQFGISPFGIYRNLNSDPNGSNTKGLQNYDDLYADVLLWDQMKWVDYLVPQLYWEMGHKLADYTELAYWWSRNVSNASYIIGQSIKRSMDEHQLDDKWAISSAVADGNVLFPHEDLLSNYRNSYSKLRNDLWKNKPLPLPIPYPSYYEGYPEPKREATILKGEGGQELVWMDDPLLPNGLETKFYVIYTHRRGATEEEILQLDNISGLTSATKYKPLNLGGKFRRALTITRIDRFNHEHIVARNILVTL